MKYLLNVAGGALLMTAVGMAQAAEPLGCVEVSVAGYKAPDYNCLSRQMGNNPEGTAAAKSNQEAQDVPVDKRPPNQLGLATPAATSTRMGSTFGTSVKPQRPAPDSATLPLLGR